VVPVAHRIVSDLDGDNNGGGDRLEGGEKSASVLLVTIWELGEAAGPLLIAPLSEVYGRWPVMNVCNVGFVAATAAAALSSSTTSFIAARCLTGLAVASNVLSPAIVGDMFVADERGAAVSLIMLAPLLGGAIGPAVAGAVAQTLGWRQVVWVSVALAGSCEVLFLVGFRETYKVRILQRRWNGERDVRVDPDASRRFWNSILRPAVVFLDSAVLQALSLYGALVFSYFYVMTTTLPDILQQGYGLSPALTGSSFIAFSESPTYLTCALPAQHIYSGHPPPFRCC
jgi:MFS family permease